MDTYIVRVYRRAGAAPHLVGVVEEIGVEGRRAFHGPDELWAILASPLTRPVARPGAPRRQPTRGSRR